MILTKQWKYNLDLASPFQLKDCSSNEALIGHKAEVKLDLPNKRIIMFNMNCFDFYI